MQGIFDWVKNKGLLFMRFFFKFPVVNLPQGGVIFIPKLKLFVSIFDFSKSPSKLGSKNLVFLSGILFVWSVECCFTNF